MPPNTRTLASSTAQKSSLHRSASHACLAYHIIMSHDHDRENVTDLSLLWEGGEMGVASIFKRFEIFEVSEKIVTNDPSFFGFLECSREEEERGERGECGFIYLERFLKFWCVLKKFEYTCREATSF